MKIKERIQFIFKNKKVVCAIGITTILFLLSLLFIIVYSNKNTTYASAEGISQTQQQPLTINSSQINLEQIVQDNIKAIQKEEIVIEESDIEFTTTYQENFSLPKGAVQVLQEGRDGKQQVIVKKIYQGEELAKEERTTNQVITAPINKIVQVGTGVRSNSYQAKVGDALYVTSYTLAVREEPDTSARKVITINQNEKVILVEKKDSWYKVFYDTYTGWVDSACLTTGQTGNSGQDDTSQGEGFTDPNTQGGKLNFEMSLNRPSGLSLEQFKKVLSNNSNDKNYVFEQNSEYFYYIEKQYQVNGLFVAAVGIHESNWGTSGISQRKKNLFGYGAYDSDPSNSAYTFDTYGEGIDLVARVFVKYYLNPAGTKIYDGQVAAGSHYNGPTLSGVNTKYATDKNWANGVYKWMQYLYNRL